VGDSSASTPTCALGPNGNVCACVDQPLLGQVPNLYFVLDRSGSMNDENKWGTIVQVVTQVVLALGPRINVGIAVFPSPAGGANTCLAGIPVVPLSPGGARAGELGPTANEILNTLGRVGAQGGTPTASTLVGLLSLLKTFSGKTYVVLATDGGPNCNTNAECDASQCQADIESAPGCDTKTNCCAAPGGALNCLDGDPTTNAVQTLADNGFPVYVVGIPGSGPYAALLDALAVAGGTARQPNGPGPQYYNIATTDKPAFAAALSQVAAKVAGHCTLMLDAVPPNPNLVNVFLDEQPLATGAGCVAASSSTDASSEAEPMGEPSTCNWVLEGQTVTILGAACQQIMAGDVLDVRVVAGCPTLIH
jgi:von Willebrand factor type A domain